MKAATIKAYNKRRRRYLMRIYAKAFGIKYAARRKYREKEIERFLIKFSNYCFVSCYIQPRF